MQQVGGAKPDRRAGAAGCRCPKAQPIAVHINRETNRLSPDRLMAIKFPKGGRGQPRTAQRAFGPRSHGKQQEESAKDVCPSGMCKALPSCKRFEQRRNFYQLSLFEVQSLLSGKARRRPNAAAKPPVCFRIRCRKAASARRYRPYRLLVCKSAAGDACSAAAGCPFHFVGM